MLTDNTPRPAVSSSQSSALAMFDAACRNLLAGEAQSTRALVPAYRDLAPMGHAEAASTRLDLGFLSRAFALGGAALLGARHLMVQDEGAPCFPDVVALGAETVRLRSEPADATGADGLTLLTGLAVEAEKAQRLLGTLPPRDAPALSALIGDDVLAHFADAEAAHDAIAALIDAPAERRVVLRRTRAAQRDPIAFPRPTIVLAGRTALAREMFSPFARRLARELGQLAGGQTAADLYTAVFTLCSTEPGVHHERTESERTAAVIPMDGGVLVDTAALNPALVDEAVRPALGALKSAGTDLFIAEPGADLAVALTDASATGVDQVVAIVGLADAWGARDISTSALHKSARGEYFSPAAFSGVPAVVTSGVPSLGLCPADAAGSGAVFVVGLDQTLSASLALRYAGVMALTATTQTVLTPAGDIETAMAAVARVLGVRAAPTAVRPSHGLR